MEITDFIKPELPFYDSILQQLKGSIKSKARKFVREKRVYRLDAFTWQVYHIPGYNKTNYFVKMDENGLLRCNCQYHVKTQNVCSHIAAVLLEEKR